MIFARIHMKLSLSFCLVLCFTSMSCERHEQLRREIFALDAAHKKEEEAIRQCEADIAAHGGNSALTLINGQMQVQQEKMRPLEFDNPSRERKWAAIEAEYARLKPAVEAFKAAQSK